MDIQLFNIYAFTILLALFGVWGWVRYYNTSNGKKNLFEK